MSGFEKAMYFATLDLWHFVDFFFKTISLFWIMVEKIMMCHKGTHYYVLKRFKTKFGKHTSLALRKLIVEMHEPVGNIINRLTLAIT